MLFLVDGYNVAMADPNTRELAKEPMRAALVGRLARGAVGLLGKGSVVVVFDAREQLGHTAETIGPVRVVYATDADTEIVRRAAAAKEHVVVVSNDMRLRARLSQDVARRVEYRDASTCFEGAEPSRRGLKRAATSRDIDLPSDADRITAELKKLWLPDEDA
jgi:predicted RNA-binding protein with PIN domain